MKRILLIALTALGGVSAGGGSGLAVLYLKGSTQAHAKPTAINDSELTFEKVDPILAPLVFEDGRLAGYASFTIALEVPLGEVETVRGRLPLLLNAINLRTFKEPLAAGPDGMIPDLEKFKAIVQTSSPQTIGPNIVRRVVIIQATPA
jgi:hypothetical protein